MLRLGIAPGKLYRATFICQDGLCCCNMALISFRLFRKNWATCEIFLGKWFTAPPGKKFPVRLCPYICSCLAYYVFFSLYALVNLSACTPVIPSVIKDRSVCHIKVYAFIISPLKLGQGLNQSVRLIFLISCRFLRHTDLE